MFRLFLDHATKWMAIGVLAIFAIGGFPGIAAACEGGGKEPPGEEDTVGSEFVREEALADDMLNQNPFGVEAEIVIEPVPEAGKGKITNVGSCKKGNKVAAKGKCAFEQERPVGAQVTWRK
jgi:hypothetical protein